MTKNHLKIVGVLLVLVGTATVAMAILSLRGYERMGAEQLKDLEFLMNISMDQLRYSKYLSIVVGLVEALSGTLAIIFYKEQRRARMLSALGLLMIAALVANLIVSAKLNGFGFLTIGEFLVGLILPVLYLLQAMRLGQGVTKASQGNKG